jgi:hypothetical protein
MNEQTKRKIELVLKGIIIALVILVFELGIIRNGFYEKIAEFVRFYSRTITIGLAGLLLSVGCVILYGGFTEEDAEGNVKINIPTLIALIVIPAFALFEISRIW